MDIGGYSINGYQWPLMAILLMAINGYQWPLMAILLMAIGGYSINGYWQLIY